MELKEIISLLLTSATVIIALYNFRSSRSRIKLKDDLDILKRYREEFGPHASLEKDKSYFCLRNKIKHRMRKTYVLYRTDMSDVVTGVAFILLSILPWTLPAILNYQLPWDWKIAISVLFGFTAAYFIFMGLKNKGRERC